MPKARAFYFESIHRFNLPLVWLLSKCGAIRCIRADLPASRLRSLRVEHLDFENIDDWMDSNEIAHEAAKRWLEFWRPRKVFAQRNIDITPILLQTSILSLERSVMYMQSTKLSKEASANLILSSFALKNKLLLRNLGLFPDAKVLVSLSLLNSILDKLNEFFTKDLRFIFGLVVRALTKKADTSIETAKVIIRGISTGEYPTGENQLDFSWWLTQRVVPKDSLFVTQTPIDEKSKAYLASIEARTISDSEVPSYVGLPSVILCAFKGLLQALVARSEAADYFGTTWRVATRALIWKTFLLKLNCRVLISSVSECFPENAEVCSAKALNIRTINWSYSGSNYYFSSRNSSFRDLNVWQCLSAASEVWCWTPTIKSLLEERQISDDYRPLFKVTGPLMCGNPNWISNTEAARAKLNITANSKVLGVFDIPVYKPLFRLKYGLGPYTTAQIQESMFKACIEALEKIPDLVVLLKFKRSLGGQYEELPSLRKLTDINSRWVIDRRVILADAKTDPFLAIAACNFCVATPFSSPPVVAEVLGIPGAYFDGTVQKHFTFKNTFSDNTFFTEQSFIDWINNCLNSKELKKVRPIRCIEELRENLNHENFITTQEH